MKSANFSLHAKALGDSWKHLRANWIVATSDKFVLLFSLLALGMLVLRWRALPPAVPLWYSRPWGEEQLAHPVWLFLLPASGLLWHGVTIVVSATLTSDHPVFARVLFLASFLTSFLLFVTLMNIIFLVT